MKTSALLSLGLLLAPALAGAAIHTGPEVGAKIPSFEVRDQHGEVRTFADLRGPEGLLLLFYRTADW